jgi:hypothetical protein
MIRLTTSGHRVVLSPKNPFTKFATFVDFSQYYDGFHAEIVPPPHNHLEWDVFLSDGHRYRYTYTFAPTLLLTPDFYVCDFYQEACSRNFVFIFPTRLQGGEAFNYWTRQYLTNKILLF